MRRGYFPVRNSQIGRPEYRRDRYDIEAVAATGAIPPEASAKERNDKLRLMLQTLLTERFKLIVHRETKEQPVYASWLAKMGPNCRRPQWERRAAPIKPRISAIRRRLPQLGGGQGKDYMDKPWTCRIGRDINSFLPTGPSWIKRSQRALQSQTWDGALSSPGCRGGRHRGQRAETRLLPTRPGDAVCVLDELGPSWNLRPLIG